MVAGRDDHRSDRRRVSPEILVQEVLDFLAQKGFTDKSELEVMPEHIALV